VPSYESLDLPSISAAAILVGAAMVAWGFRTAEEGRETRRELARFGAALAIAAFLIFVFLDGMSRASAGPN
jgi:hypothetical protein